MPGHMGKSGSSGSSGRSGGRSSMGRNKTANRDPVKSTASGLPSRTRRMNASMEVQTRGGPRFGGRR